MFYILKGKLESFLNKLNQLDKNNKLNRNYILNLSKSDVMVEIHDRDLNLPFKMEITISETFVSLVVNSNPLLLVITDNLNNVIEIIDKLNEFGIYPKYNLVKRNYIDSEVPELDLFYSFNCERNPYKIHGNEECISIFKIDNQKVKNVEPIQFLDKLLINILKFLMR